MALHPDDPQYVPPSADTTPLWQRVTDLLGLSDEINALGGQLRDAQTWVRSKAGLETPEAKAREVALRADLDRRSRNQSHDVRHAREAVSRLFNSQPVQTAYNATADRLWRPAPEVKAAFDAVRGGMEERQAALDQALPGAAGAPIRIGSRVLDLLPSLGLDVAQDNTTPFGMVQNFVEPLALAGPVMGAAAPFVLPRRAGTLAKALKRTGTVGEYALRTPTLERIRQLYEHGIHLPYASNWSSANAERLLEAFDNDPAAALRWGRMWAATSPNTSVPVNTRESVSALAHSLLNPGQLLSLEEARALPGAKITMAGSKVPNINRALQGLALGGDKVEAMGGYMSGQDRLPLDVHALFGLGTTGDKLDAELPALRALMTGAEGLPYRRGLTNTDLYLRTEDALGRALREIDPKRGIVPAFGDLWEGIRDYKGLRPQGAPIDILGQRGLLERGAMTDPERMLDALGTKRWAVRPAPRPEPSRSFLDLGAGPAPFEAAPPAGAPAIVSSVGDRPLNIAVAMEQSGRVRDAFRNLGHNAWSVDQMPDWAGSPHHVQGDVFDVIKNGRLCDNPLDAIMGHPACTYLAGSGQHWNTRVPGRAAKTDAAAADFLRLYNTPGVEHVALENPVGVMSSRFRPPDQYYHPYQLGADASKKTGLWLRGFDPLPIDPELAVAPRWVTDPATGKSLPRWGNQLDSGQNRTGQTADRWLQRSATSPEVADWLAEGLSEQLLRKQRGR